MRRVYRVYNAPMDSEGAPGGVAVTPPLEGGQSGQWYSGFSSPELRGVVENNGWKSAEDAVRNYAELNKMLGVPKDYLLKVPKDDTDKDGWNQVYSRLGRPEKAEDYGLAALKNADPEYAAMIAGVMHEHGVSKKAATAIVEKHGAFLEAYLAKQAEQGQQKAQAETEQLKSEWGDKYQETVERGGQALKELWGDQADAVVDALQSKFGVRSTAHLIAKLADKSGEANFRASGEGTGGSSGFGMSPDGAKAKIEQLKKDPDFVKQMFGDNKQQAAQAAEQMRRLMAIAYPGNIEGVGASAAR